MKPIYRGIVIAVLQCAMVLSIAGKYAVDRATLPRTWVRALPYDPNLPIRGRYVRMRLDGFPRQEPVVFFIPEHVPDPSFRPPGEELWVQVSLPKSGPPRPVRLGVKKNGVLTPLDFE